MKITKFPQSCIVIDNGTSRIVIDPGNLVAPHFNASDIGPVDGILVTHEHGDHADPSLIHSLSSSTTMVISNKSAQQHLGDVITQVVEDR